MRELIGKRVKVLEHKGVCTYLYGHTGVIERLREVKGEKDPHYIINFDIPAWNGARGWTPLETIGLKREMFEETKEVNKASERSRSYKVAK